MSTQTDLTNKKIQEYKFLPCMYQDGYFPDFLVDKCTQVLLQLCHNIETHEPKSLNELYALTHESTNDINLLQEEFEDNGSEIETVARECLANDFDVIAKAYGFDADIEELIATRDW